MKNFLLFSFFTVVTIYGIREQEGLEVYYDDDETEELVYFYYDGEEESAPNYTNDFLRRWKKIEQTCESDWLDRI